MVWGNILIIAACAWLAETLDFHYFPARVSPGWGYFMPPFLHKASFHPEPTAMELMVDITNSLGVAVLQDYAYSRGNFAFSPYGMASVLVVLYEGACGESARQIQRTVGFPSDKDVIRVGFRDIHRHLRSYFSHEGFLSGITLNKEASTLNPEYKMILKFYGYDVDLSADEDKKMNDDKITTKTTTKTTTKATPSVTRFHSTEQTTLGSWNATNEHSTEYTTKTEADEGNSVVSTTQSGITKTTDIDELTTRLETTTLANTDTTEKFESNTDGVHETSTEFTENSKTKKIGTSTATASLNENEINQEVTKILHESEFGETQSATVPFTTSFVPENTADEWVMITSTTQEPPIEEKKNEVDSTLDNGMLIPQSVDLEETTISFSNKLTSVDGKVQSADSSTLNMKSQTVTPTTEPIINEKGTTTMLSTSETPSKTTTDITDITTKPDTNSSFEHTKTAPFDVESKAVPTTEEAILPSTIPETENFIEKNKPTSSTIDDSKTDNNTEANQTTASTEENAEQQTSQTTTDMNGAEYTTTEMNEISSDATETDIMTVKTPSETESSTIGIEIMSTTFSSTFLNNETTDFVATIMNDKTYQNSKDKKEDLRENQSDRMKITSEASGQSSGFFITGKKSMKTSEERSRRRKRRTIIDYLKSPIKPDLSLQLQNGMYDTYVSKNMETYRNLPRYLFLVDGVVDTPVPMMTYTNVFRLGYIPSLHSRALEFPLDDVRYKLLILLPLERRGLRQLLHDLRGCPLREIIESIRPAKVRVTIPTFMVEGFVILTSTLQKLGIWDVFDPRRANLSGMSTDPELYVRNVEQSVTVVIRNYVEILDIQTRTMAARQVIHDFEASHPFVYFVLDSATNVALMAGQMLDPLNSRIY